VPKIAEMSKDYTIFVKRGSWVNDIPSTVQYIDLEVSVYENGKEVAILDVLTDIKDYISTDLEFFPVDTFNFSYIEIGAKEELEIKFRVVYGKNGINTYYAESDTFKLTLNGSGKYNEYYPPSYCNMNGMILESGKEYIIPFTTLLQDYENRYGYVGIVASDSSNNNTDYVDGYFPFEIVDKCKAKFTIPDLSGIIKDRSYCKVVLLFFPFHPTSSTNKYHAISATNGYRVIYVNDNNNKYPLV
jgi:hypothetical protein